MIENARARTDSQTMQYLLVLLTTLLLAPLAALHAAALPEQTGWEGAPAEEWMTTAADYSTSQRGQTMVVMVDGQIVFERCDNGGAVDKVQMLASGSKSFVGVAAAAAVQDQLIKLDDPVGESITEWKADPQKAGITYRQLLTLITHPQFPGYWNDVRWHRKVTSVIRKEPT
jgi:CubicO group peptidase (beta-lactamase class C family)